MFSDMFINFRTTQYQYFNHIKSVNKISVKLHLYKNSTNCHFPEEKKNSPKETIFM